MCIFSEVYGRGVPACLIGVHSYETYQALVMARASPARTEKPAALQCSLCHWQSAAPDFPHFVEVEGGTAVPPVCVCPLLERNLKTPDSGVGPTRVQGRYPATSPVRRDHNPGLFEVFKGWALPADLRHLNTNSKTYKTGLVLVTFIAAPQPSS